jgi:hypothetical protein
MVGILVTAPTSRPRMCMVAKRLAVTRGYISCPIHDLLHHHCIGGSQQQAQAGQQLLNMRPFCCLLRLLLLVSVFAFFLLLLLPTAAAAACRCPGFQLLPCAASLGASQISARVLQAVLITAAALRCNWCHSANFVAGCVFCWCGCLHFCCCRCSPHCFLLPVAHSVSGHPLLPVSSPCGCCCCLQEPLIAHPVYRQAVLDTAAALRCNWCHFLSSFCGQPQLPLLVRAVMAQHVERLRLQAVRRVVGAIYMLGGLLRLLCGVCSCELLLRFGDCHKQCPSGRRGYNHGVQLG